MLVEAPVQSNAIGVANAGLRVQGPGGNTTPGSYASFQDGSGGTSGQGMAPDGKIGLHFDGWNYLFIDGHVKWLRPDATIKNAGVTYPFNPGTGASTCAGTMSNPCGMWTMAAND
jgi:prepilin-type processing-associated H-X9-DG protein